MLTPERLAELERVLMQIEDEEYHRQLRAMIEHDRRQCERAAGKQSAHPRAQQRWVIIATLPALSAGPDGSS
jgi:hypothetical protein